MRLGVDGNSLLREFHPDALDLYAVSSCLRRLATELSDPQRRLRGAQISLFCAFRSGAVTGRRDRFWSSGGLRLWEGSGLAACSC